MHPKMGAAVPGTGYAAGEHIKAFQQKQNPHTEARRA